MMCVRSVVPQDFKQYFSISINALLQNFAKLPNLVLFDKQSMCNNTYECKLKFISLNILRKLLLDILTFKNSRWNFMAPGATFPLSSDNLHHDGPFTQDSVFSGHHLPVTLTHSTWQSDTSPT